MLVASDDPRLGDSDGTAATSPFVLAVSAAGVKAIPSIVNAVVITSAFSSSNQALLAGTRVLYGLAIKGQAPKIFLWTTRWGVPYMCVLTYTAFAFLAFMTLSDGALTVFFWFVDLVGCGVLISWMAILVNHLRLVAAMKKQGIARSSLPWQNAWTPYASWAALVMCVIIILTNGFEVFTTGGWSAAGFITAYLDIGLVTTAYVGWKLFKRTKLVSLKDIPLEEVLLQIALTPEDAELEAKGWLRYIAWMWD